MHPAATTTHGAPPKHCKALHTARANTRTTHDRTDSQESATPSGTRTRKQRLPGRGAVFVLKQTQRTHKKRPATKGVAGLWVFLARSLTGRESVEALRHRSMCIQAAAYSSLNERDSASLGSRRRTHLLFKRLLTARQTATASKPAAVDILGVHSISPPSTP